MSSLVLTGSPSNEVGHLALLAPLKSVTCPSSEIRDPLAWLVPAMVALLSKVMSPLA